MTDRRVLPRWHQDDRGPTNASRGWHEAAEAGAYAWVPAWPGRDRWLAFVVPVALRLHADQLHRVVSPGLLRRYLTVASGYVQDQKTGRRCIVRPDTIASVLGCSKRAVQICRRTARQIGLEVVVKTGRMLTFAEVASCRRRGSTQRGLSTEVAFTIPTAVSSDLGIFTPTSGPWTTHQRHLILHYLNAARGETSDAASPRPRPPGSAGGPRPRRRGPRAGRRLAIGLVRAVAWLAGEAPGRLAPALQRFAAAGWDTDGTVLKLREASLRRGRDFDHLTAASIRTRPAAVLASLLRDLDPDADHPEPPDLHPHATSHTTPDTGASWQLADQSCGRPDCVRGWIDLPDGSAAKCPDCPPAVRAPHDTEFLDGEATTPTQWDDDEPPF